MISGRICEVTLLKAVPMSCTFPHASINMNRESNWYHGSNGYKVDGPCLKIIVVGAGLSGLGVGIQSALSGHSVLILESAKELGEVRKYIIPKPPQKL